MGEGIIVGSVCWIIALVLFFTSIFDIVPQKMKEECELPLARTEHCEYIAVPASSIKKENVSDTNKTND